MVRQSRLKMQIFMMCKYIYIYLTKTYRTTKLGQACCHMIVIPRNTKILFIFFCKLYLFY